MVQKAAKPRVKAVAFDPYGDVTTLLDDVERKVGMTDATMSREGRMSSGLLTMDLILGGGYTAGWYTNFGQEQSCKTTQAVTTLFSSLAYDVPIRHYDDYEGSGGGAPDYLEAIMKNVTQGKHSNITDVFGIRDLKGKWVKKPIIRYRSEIVGETFFDFLSMLMRRLPDKKKIGDKWWFIYDDTKENRAKVGNEYDKNYFAETKRLRVPAPDGSLQAVIVLDSYPAMLPEKQDVDDPNSALAVQARMFSEQLRRVKGRVRSKRILIQGINQLRLKIGVMFGSPEFEPGGEALKLYCFGEDTLIFTEKGLLKGKELLGFNYGKVLGRDGLETPSVYKAMGVSPVSTVQTEYGFSVTAKPNHALFTLTRGATETAFTKMRDLSTNEYVAIKVGQNVWPEKKADLRFTFLGKKGQGTNQRQVDLTFPSEVTPELCRLAGYLVGEGHVRENRIIFSNIDRDIFDDFLYCMQKVFSLSDDYMDRKQKVLTHDNEHSTQFVFDCYSTQMGEFFGYLGLMDKASRYKEIPWFIRQSTRKEVVEFIKALFDGEASVTKTGSQLTFTSSSPTLAKQVHLLLLNMGIVGKLTPYKMDWLDKEFKHRDTNKYAGINFYGADVSLYARKIGFTSSRKTARLEQRKGVEDNGQDFLNRLPDVFSYKDNTKKAADYLVEHLDLDPDSRKQGRKYLRLDEMEDRIAYARSKVKGLRTQQERDRNKAFLDSLENLVKLTQEQNLFWTKVISVTHNQDPIPTYDFHMPKSHTVVTDGVVSHNSDVRNKFTSRAISAVDGAVGKGQIEEEESVDGEGVDTYRYIHVKNIKNKFHTPYLETFLRLWIRDSEGVAQGFDPVFDTFEYLRMTGQVENVKRKKIWINLAGKEKASKFIGWRSFKRLILGSDEEVKAICKKIGISPVRLRRFCQKQLASGAGLDLHFEQLKESAKKRVIKSAKAESTESEGMGEEV